MPTNIKRIEGSADLGDEAGTISAIFLPQVDWDTQVTTSVEDANGTSTSIVNVNAFTPETVAWIDAFPMHPGTIFPNTGAPVRRVGNNYEIDATSQIKAWQKGAETDFGFMLIGRDESLPEKENKAWQANYNVLLRVLVNPNSP